MNKARLQTQTGAGRLVTLTMNNQSRKSAWVTVDLLQISTICFISAFTYEWLKTQKGRLEVGEGMNIDDASVCPVEGRGGGGQNGACHSYVHHLFSQWGRRDNAGDSWWQRQLVVPLAPASDPLWGDTSSTKKEKENGKKRSLTNQNSRPDALPAPTGDQCHEDARLACQTIPSLSKRHITPSFCFHLPFLESSSPISILGTEGCRLNQVTFPLFYFFHPKFEYEKGLSLTQSKTITLMTFGSHLIY